MFLSGFKPCDFCSKRRDGFDGGFKRRGFALGGEALADELMAAAAVEGKPPSAILAAILLDWYCTRTQRMAGVLLHGCYKIEPITAGPDLAEKIAEAVAHRKAVELKAVEMGTFEQRQAEGKRRQLDLTDPTKRPNSVRQKRTAAR
jgi:hypothetical protein